MGAVGGLLGLGGGAGGTGFTPQSGVSQESLNNTLNASNASMGQQQNLLSALQAQNGLQNQSNVYGQLQNVASGQGPNPAQAMLNQATGANVANQAALMAGQRGAGQNVGLMARQAAQQGANLQQQAAGQGASMQAQQALGALGQAGNMANTMAGNQIGQTNANTAAQQNQLGILQGANTAAENVQGQLANTQLGGIQSLIGGVMGAGASAGKMAAGAEGGLVQKFADGGAAFTPQSMFAQSLNGSNSAGSLPTFMSSSGADSLKKGVQNLTTKKPATSVPMGTTSTPTQGGNFAGSDMTSGAAINGDGLQKVAHGGKVPALVSPGEKFLKPHEAKAVAEGKADPMEVGETIPGKAKVKGDSYKNDTVRRDLDEGGIVVPRHVMQGKHPGFAAKKFVDDVLSKKGRKF